MPQHHLQLQHWHARKISKANAKGYVCLVHGFEVEKQLSTCKIQLAPGRPSRISARVCPPQSRRRTFQAPKTGCLLHESTCEWKTKTTTKFTCDMELRLLMFQIWSSTCTICEDVCYGHLWICVRQWHQHPGQQRVERVISTTDRLVRRHLTIRLNTMLQAEEFPAGVADLHTWRGTWHGVVWVWPEGCTKITTRSSAKLTVI